MLVPILMVGSALDRGTGGRSNLGDASHKYHPGSGVHIRPSYCSYSLHEELDGAAMCDR